jgi:thymidine phosphorylase
MDRPLGAAVGNALEVAESLEVLRNRGDAALRSLCLDLGTAMLELAGLAQGAAARARLEQSLADGSALRVFAHVIEVQGGDPRVTDDPTRLPSAPEVRTVPSPTSGWFAGFDARLVAEVCLELGAGRRRAEDRVDPAVGVDAILPAGARVEKGQPVARVHARTPAAAEAAMHMLQSRASVVDAPLDIPALLMGEG